ncbi:MULTISPECIES: aminopeptidase P N-terminal domain-containing protein [Flavobacteriaceae]|uniref:Xaa-Pro aminopeptidase n=2 Tax=Flavobacteriaceae TaxID=49546 RepID=A0A4Y8AVQ6_9FLAO|nr:MULTISPECIES: aminopeptidase P N-terminal domain-containing protein [Flavobacteriaceae]TEW76626.1 M24 family metallopeptidase [Gramella jeungdoensis]GGK51431.1 Xaa-Pro aminopeptidase [Lutibacter litoralis]
MKLNNTFLVFFFVFLTSFSQNNELPQDYLTKDFHKDRREQLRKKMPNNSVAVFFANAVRNRANDVDYVYHQDPNFYYLTGYKEPHAMVLIFKENQNVQGKTFNEVLFVQERSENAEMWTGTRLGVLGAQDQLGFRVAYNGREFKSYAIDFSKFDKILFYNFKNDVRDSKDDADLYDLIKTFKEKVSFDLIQLKNPAGDNMHRETKKRIDTPLLKGFMASLREIKTKEELVLLKKAIEISAIGQLEIMKAMHPTMSETEAQGVHEFVYKKYGAEYEGYPSIVGAGNNGCILHYVDNNKTLIGDNNLILMDLGAEYHGYTADVTRTIPANGKFSPEQKLIYDLVFKAQEAGIAAYKIGTKMDKPNAIAKKIINKGLADLGIIASEKTRHSYFPHGTSHHIGLDVHDPGNYKKFEENMVVTMEPGIYIPNGSDCDEKWWGIGVRIEDDILVTKEGPVNLSAMAPRTSSAIEATMKLPSVLDSFVLPKLD